MPANPLCTYAQTSALINGLEIDGLTGKRPSLLEACELYQIPHMDKAEKAVARDLILHKEIKDYTCAEWDRIERYNEVDTKTDIALFFAEAPAIDLPAALFRGRYSKAVVGMEATGLPAHTDYLTELSEAWQALRLHYIRQLDHLQLYDEEATFMRIAL